MSNVDVKQKTETNCNSVKNIGWKLNDLLGK